MWMLSCLGCHWRDIQKQQSTSKWNVKCALEAPGVCHCFPGIDFALSKDDGVNHNIDVDETYFEEEAAHGPWVPCHGSLILACKSFALPRNRRSNLHCTWNHYDLPVGFSRTSKLFLLAGWSWSIRVEVGRAVASILLHASLSWLRLIGKNYSSRWWSGSLINALMIDDAVAWWGPWRWWLACLLW